MLVVIWTLEKWKYFLKGIEISIKIWTDHKSLKYFMIVRNLNYRQV